MKQTKDALDQLGAIKEPFCFTTDNCSVKKKAFSQLKNLNSDPDEEVNTDISNVSEAQDVFLIEHQFGDAPANFINWLGCAAHQLQFVVSDGMKKAAN